MHQPWRQLSKNDSHSRGTRLKICSAKQSLHKRSYSTLSAPGPACGFVRCDLSAWQETLPKHLGYQESASCPPQCSTTMRPAAPRRRAASAQFTSTLLWTKDCFVCKKK